MRVLHLYWVHRVFFAITILLGAMPSCRDDSSSRVLDNDSPISCLSGQCYLHQDLLDNTDPGIDVTKTSPGNEGEGSGESGEGISLSDIFNCNDRNGSDDETGELSSDETPDGRCQSFDEVYKRSDLGRELGNLQRSTKKQWDKIRGKNNKRLSDAEAQSQKLQAISQIQDRAVAMGNSATSDVVAVNQVTADLNNSSLFYSFPTIQSDLSKSITEFNQGMEDVLAGMEDMPDSELSKGTVGQASAPTSRHEVINQARTYNEYAKRTIASRPNPRQHEQQALTNFADQSFNFAENRYDKGEILAGDRAVEIGLAAVDIALSLTPGVSWAKDIYEAVTGNNLVTGMPLSPTERTFAIIGAATGGMGSKAGKTYKGIRTTLEVLEDTAHVTHDAKMIEGVAEAAKAIDSAEETIHAIGPGKFADVLNTPKGSRPLPETYLPKDFIANHLAKFDDGASYLVPKETLDRFGRDLLGHPDNTQFVLPKGQLDNLLTRTSNDVSKIERELGLEAGSWEGKAIVRIDVPNPKELNVRIPSGNERGVNPNWLPGGKLPNGDSEAVINNIPKGKYIERDL